MQNTILLLRHVDNKIWFSKIKIEKLKPKKQSSDEFILTNLMSLTKSQTVEVQSINKSLGTIQGSM
jgi:hypothetical protein